MRAAQLAADFAIADTLEFAETADGLVKAAITLGDATGELFLQGAQVTHWAPAGARPVIFTSPRSAFAPGKAIRGGIPVIIPWFGPNRVVPTAPQHGFARTMAWTLRGVEHGARTLTLRLALEDDAATAALWPERFRAEYEVTFGPTLGLRLSVHNRSPRAVAFEEALHSYFTVSDVRQVSVSGLDGCRFIDKTDATRRKQQSGPVTLAGETDSVYLDTPARCVLADPGWGRRIVIDKGDAASTIVWNPWAEKARAMADLGEDAWPGMVCVETGNAADNQIMIPPGGTHAMSTVIAIDD